MKTFLLNIWWNMSLQFPSQFSQWINRKRNIKNQNFFFIWFHILSFLKILNMKFKISCLTYILEDFSLFDQVNSYILFHMRHNFSTLLCIFRFLLWLLIKILRHLDSLKIVRYNYLFLLFWAERLFSQLSFNFYQDTWYFT